MFGFPIGALPAGGAEIPTFLSYSTEKRLTKHPEEFGKGAIEGVAGPEAANNASAAGTLVPLLTLGLPTSATAAMMLAGFQQYGLNPGPLLFAERPDLVWGLIASLFIANVMLLVLNLPLVGLWVKLLAIPQPWLYAGILVFATMGTIAAKPSVVELSMLVGFGVMGFLMRRFDFPIAPVVVGLILGPIAESQLRRALAISLGDPMTLLQSPISATLLAHCADRAGGAVRAEGDEPVQGERRLNRSLHWPHAVSNRNFLHDQSRSNDSNHRLRFPTLKIIHRILIPAFATIQPRAEIESRSQLDAGSD